MAGAVGVTTAGVLAWELAVATAGATFAVTIGDVLLLEKLTAAGRSGRDVTDLLDAVSLAAPRRKFKVVGPRLGETAAEFLSRLADVEVRRLMRDLGFAASADSRESCSGLEVSAPSVACTPAGPGSIDGFGCAPEFVELEDVEPLDEEPDESVDEDPPGPASAITGLLAIAMPSPSEIANALTRPK